MFVVPLQFLQTICPMGRCVQNFPIPDRYVEIRSYFSRQVNKYKAFGKDRAICAVTVGLNAPCPIKLVRLDFCWILFVRLDFLSRRPKSNIDKKFFINHLTESCGFCCYCNLK